MRILLVDDNQSYLSSLRQMLELCLPGSSVITAEDGSSALRLAAEQQFDLMIFDYHLQTLRGSEVIRQMRARAERVHQILPPVILMSSEPDAAVFARTLGVAGFLPKPVRADALEALLLPLMRPREKAEGYKDEG